MVQCKGMAHTPEITRGSTWESNQQEADAWEVAKRQEVEVMGGESNPLKGVDFYKSEVFDVACDRCSSMCRVSGKFVDEALRAACSLCEYMGRFQVTDRTDREYWFWSADDDENLENGPFSDHSEATDDCFDARGIWCPIR